MIAIDLSKQETLDTDPKAIQINITGNLENNAVKFLIAFSEIVLDFSQGTVKLFKFYFCLNIK